MIRNFATFTSSLPDDSVEWEGDVAEPDGRNVMESIRDAFLHANYDATAVDQHSFYGWSFSVKGEHGEFWLMVQCPGPWLLMIRDLRPIWKRIFKGRGDFAVFVEECHRTLTAIPEFGELRWCNESEWQVESRSGKPGDGEAA